MANLFTLVGIPGCGKSTWADTFAGDAAIISSDEIRASLSKVEDQTRNGEVFEIFHRMINAHLAHGTSVFADATSLDGRSRLKLISIAKENDAQVHLVYFSNVAEAVLRNQRRERVVPPEAMVRMLEKYERFQMALPVEATNYDSVTEVRSFA